ncbi:cyclic nucleotide-binding domain-containing protein [Alphaproteobacteria bacterium]|mgnify:FL=1|jgi:CRP-like cAMP-binding protein|nr:cyclic nucleotide-binding domain-containing protein [Alphaproteobacteria bacterium]
MNKINHTIKNITNSGLEQVSFKKGTTIYKVNEKPKFAYYVYTGKVNIISKDEYNIGIIQEGELFGEISSLFNKEHSVSASAAEDCRLLIIEKNVFFNKVESADPILKAVIRTLSLRLNDSNKKSEEIWKQLHLLSSIKRDIEKD